MDLRLGSLVVLDRSELSALRSSVPPEWTHPVLEALEESGGTTGSATSQAADVYCFLDVPVRAAIDEVWEFNDRDPSRTCAPAERLIELAQGRLTETYPWLMDYILGSCEGCGSEQGISYVLAPDGSGALEIDLAPEDTCDFCASAIVPAQPCGSCGKSSVRGPHILDPPAATASVRCPHCGAAYDGSSPGWL